MCISGILKIGAIKAAAQQMGPKPAGLRLRYLTPK
jgi:hypothetical protein